MLLRQPADVLPTTQQSEPAGASYMYVGRLTSEKQPSTHLLPEPAPFLPMKKFSTHQSCKDVLVKSLQHARKLGQAAAALDEDGDLAWGGWKPHQKNCFSPCQGTWFSQ